MPPTSIFISAASAGTSGIGYSRISVLLGPVRTAASTVSATFRVLSVAPSCDAKVVNHASLRQEKSRTPRRRRPGARVGAGALFPGRGRDPGRRGRLRGSGLPTDRDRDRILSDERRHHFKVFKPVANVVEDDLPPSWLKPAL